MRADHWLNISIWDVNLCCYYKQINLPEHCEKRECDGDGNGIIVGLLMNDIISSLNRSW